jgi:DnaJ-domain-containing protein 1
MPAYFDDDFEEEKKPCDHEGCAGEGLYRAPRSPDSLRDYFWFCLDHVRSYNKAWNYCAGMSEDEIEDQIRRSTMWDRQTWAPGSGYGMAERLRQTVYDNAGFYGFAWQEEAPRPKPTTPYGKALEVLGLSEPVDLHAIKVRYRKLVKENHPDLNGGDPAAEERLKKINQAFHTAKRTYTEHSSHKGT